MKVYTDVLDEESEMIILIAREESGAMLSRDLCAC
jgi:hypothetical protein